MTLDIDRSSELCKGIRSRLMTGPKGLGRRLGTTLVQGDQGPEGLATTAEEFAANRVPEGLQASSGAPGMFAGNFRATSTHGKITQ